MKNNLRVKDVLRTLTMVLSIALLPTVGHAQSNQNFDAGTGTWDAGITPDWDGTNVWTAGNGATFNSNTVNVSGTVTASSLSFVGGPTTISGGTIDLANSPSAYTSINDNNNPDFSGTNANAVTISTPLELGASGPDIQYFVNNQTGFSNVANSGSTLTLGNIDWGLASGDGRLQLAGENQGGSIVLAGTYTTSGGGGGSITFGNNGSGTYTLAPTADFTHFNTGLTAQNQEGNSFGFIGDVLNIATSKFDGNQTMGFNNANSGNLVNIVGSQNIALSIYSSQKNSGPMVVDYAGDSNQGLTTIGTTAQMIFRQSTADMSTWTGGVNQNGSSIVLEAVAGGRLVWNGNIGGSAPLGMTIGSSTDATETGTVVIGRNDYNESDGAGYVQSGSTTAADLRSGTTVLVNGVDGSAFGSATTTALTPGHRYGEPDNTPGKFTTVTEVVKLEAGATLAGNGTSAPQVVSEDKSSVIAPGDPGQAAYGIAPTIGTLSLTNGLAVNASSPTAGLTLDFKLSGQQLDGTTIAGVNNDYISTATLSLAGTITINFTALGTVDTTNSYLLMTGSGAWTQAAGTKILINAPAGYELDPNWTSPDGRDPNGIDPNTGDEEVGYNLDIGSDSFTVKFIVTPEPSTYGLMGLGLLALVGIRRFRRLSA